MSATTFLYTLNCPMTGEIRYLGKSDNPFKRFKNHVRDAHLYHNHRNHWILSLRARNLSPTMELLDEVPTAEWQFWEREYIRVFEAINIKLTNGTKGGEGCAGTPEVCAKIGNRLRGIKRSNETRQKIRLSKTGSNNHNFGKKFPLEHCRKISLAHVGTRHSKETLQKMSKPRTAEHRLAMSVAHLGKPGWSNGPLSQEHRNKISTSMRGKPWSEARRKSVKVRKEEYVG